MANAATHVALENEKVDQNGFDSNQILLIKGAIGRTGSSGGIAERFERVLTFVEIVLDVLTASGAVIFAYFVNGFFIAASRSLTQISIIALAFGVFCALMLDREGAYRRGNSLLRVRETERILRVCAQSYIVALALIRFGQWPLSMRSLNLATAVVCAALLAEKHLVYVVVRLLHARGLGVRKVIIVGAGYTGRRVYSALVRSPKLGLKPTAMFDENPLLDGTRVYEPSYKRDGCLQVKSVSFENLQLQDCSECIVVIAIPSLPRDKFVKLLNLATTANVKFAFVPTHHVPNDLWIEHSDIDGLLLESFAEPSSRTLYETAKRIFDITLSSCVLAVTLPFWLIFAVLIRYESPGPILFRQKRVGKGGRLFQFYKFRTMYQSAPAYSVSPTDSTDPRITPIGRFLRRTSLDELPQLLNVLKGEMSLVGPRPEMPFLVERYTLLHRQRLQVKPGITGLWQISADRRFLIHENIEYDLYYIRNKSFFMDLAIALHTLFFAMRGI